MFQKDIGTVKLQDGQAVIYTSHTVFHAELNYSSIERDLLAVGLGLERLNHYTCGNTGTVHADHKLQSQYR